MQKSASLESVLKKLGITNKSDIPELANITKKRTDEALGEQAGYSDLSFEEFVVLASNKKYAKWLPSGVLGYLNLDNGKISEVIIECGDNFRFECFKFLDNRKLTPEATNKILEMLKKQNLFDNITSVHKILVRSCFYFEKNQDRKEFIDYIENEIFEDGENEKCVFDFEIFGDNWSLNEFTNEDIQMQQAMKNLKKIHDEEKLDIAAFGWFLEPDPKTKKNKGYIDSMPGWVFDKFLKLDAKDQVSVIEAHPELFAKEEIVEKLVKVSTKEEIVEKLVKVSITESTEKYIDTFMKHENLTKVLVEATKKFNLLELFFSNGYEYSENSKLKGFINWLYCNETKYITKEVIMIYNKKKYEIFESILGLIDSNTVKKLYEKQKDKYKENTGKNEKYYLLGCVFFNSDCFFDFGTKTEINSKTVQAKLILHEDTFKIVLLGLSDDISKYWMDKLICNPKKPRRYLLAFFDAEMLYKFISFGLVEKLDDIYKDEYKNMFINEYFLKLQSEQQAYIFAETFKNRKNIIHCRKFLDILLGVDSLRTTDFGAQIFSSISQLGFSALSTGSTNKKRNVFDYFTNFDKQMVSDYIKSEYGKMFFKINNFLKLDPFTQTEILDIASKSGNEDLKKLLSDLLKLAQKNGDEANIKIKHVFIYFNDEQLYNLITENNAFLSFKSKLFLELKNDLQARIFEIALKNKDNAQRFKLFLNSFFEFVRDKTKLNKFKFKEDFERMLERAKVIEAISNTEPEFLRKILINVPSLSIINSSFLNNLNSDKKKDILLKRMGLGLLGENECKYFTCDILKELHQKYSSSLLMYLPVGFLNYLKKDVSNEFVKYLDNNDDSLAKKLKGDGFYGDDQFSKETGKYNYQLVDEETTVQNLIELMCSFPFERLFKTASNNIFKEFLSKIEVNDVEIDIARFLLYKYMCLDFSCSISKLAIKLAYEKIAISYLGYSGKEDGIQKRELVLMLCRYPNHKSSEYKLENFCKAIETIKPGDIDDKTAEFLKFKYKDISSEEYKEYPVAEKVKKLLAECEKNKNGAHVKKYNISGNSMETNMETNNDNMLNNPDEHKKLIQQNAIKK